MKKIVAKLLLCSTFLFLLLLNISIGKSNIESKRTSLKNIEALACYEVELNGSSQGSCCPPWDNVCLHTGGAEVGWDIQLPGVLVIRL